MNATQQRQSVEPTDSDATTEQVAALRSEVDTLRHDVEQKERHLQATIDRYEAVLTDVTWEYERRIRELESAAPRECALHRLARWLVARMPGG